MFAQHFTTTGKLEISASSFFDPSSGAVATAGSAQFNAPGFGNGEVIRNKLVAGVDLNGAAIDGEVNFNFGATFELDPNAAVDYANGDINFYSVFMHEMTHAFGFGSNIDAAGDTPGAYSKWDQFLTNKSGVHVVDATTGLVNKAAYMDAQQNGGYFAGAFSLAAFGRFVPVVINDDISHLDTDTFSPPNVSINALMLCCGSSDPRQPRDYIAAEVGIMADLGYLQVKVSTVPEPSTTALMMLGGLGIVGVLRRSKKSATL